MSSRRESSSDYPEHLNPFYEGDEKLRFWRFGKVKRSGSFGETLRNTLTLKSLRKKKKDNQETPPSPPEIRKHEPIHVPYYRQTLPTYSPAQKPPVPLPRSRFSERVRKVEEKDDEEKKEQTPCQTIFESAKSNPFEEDEKTEPVLKPKRIKRKKKRAPLPPNTAREDGDIAYLGVSSMHNFSKWSLTSVETEVSTYSESEHELTNLSAIQTEMSEIINTMTKEMEKLTDDVENSCSDDQHVNERCNVPDLIVSSTEAAKDEDRKSLDAQQAIDENSNLVTTKGSGTIEDECHSPNIYDELQSNALEQENKELEINTCNLTYKDDLPEENGNVSDTFNDEPNCTNQANEGDETHIIEDEAENEKDRQPAKPKCKTEMTIVLNGTPPASSMVVGEDDKTDSCKDVIQVDA